MALQKAFDILEEVPVDQRLDGAKKMFKNAPAGTELSERAFVAVLENLRAVKGDDAIRFSMQFKTEIYSDNQRREPTPEIISQKTRAVDLVVEMLEKYPDYEFRDSLAGKLVRDVAQVDPEKREDLLKRLEAISPKSTMLLSIAENKALHISVQPSVPSPSIEARRLAQKLLGLN
jgi:hypothetical protein